MMSRMHKEVDQLLKKSCFNNKKWEDILRRYITFQESRNRSPDTIYNTLRSFIYYLTWFKTASGRYPKPMDISAESVLTWLKGVELSPSTKKLRFTEIKSFLKTCYEFEAIKSYPMICMIPSPKVPRIVRYIFTDEELKKIWSVVYQKQKGRSRYMRTFLFELLISSAPRMKELCNMRWQFIDLQRETVEFQQKGGSVRIISLPTAASKAALIWKNRSPSEYVFRSNKMLIDKPTSKEAIRNILRHWYKEAGIYREKHFGVHLFRHTLATRAYILTRDIESVRKLMGHASTETTMRYIHLPYDETAALSRELSVNFRELKEVTKDDEEEL